MNVRTAAALIALAGAQLAPLAAQATPAAPADLARLQGQWSMVSGSIEGLALPAEYVTSGKRVAVGDTVTVTFGGRLFMKAAVTLNPSRSPKEIDYHVSGGDTAGALQLGIYQIAGDTVRFCFAAPNAPRPTAFTSSAGDGRVLSVWVRANP